MANHKRGQRLDKSTRAAVSGIDAILAELAEDVIRPDEFTAKMTYEQHVKAGGTRTLASIRAHLLRRSNEGKLKSRSINIDGKITTVYSLP
jgi:hypothetical protein